MHLRPLVRPTFLRAALAATLFASGCGNNNGVASEDSARRAYLGIDKAVDRALDLSLQGYNNATSANIPPQMASGDVTGTITVEGQVSHGSSGNHSVNVSTTFVTYRDTVQDMNHDLVITYDSGGDAGTPPALSVMLRNVPSGTFDGTYAGALVMSGDLAGDVTLALSISGNLQLVPGTTDHIQRVPGSTHITGTATSPYGSYAIDITR